MVHRKLKPQEADLDEDEGEKKTKVGRVFGSVADPGCLSWIPDPDFLPIPDLGFRITDLKTSTKERGEKNLLSHLFCSHMFLKIENYFIFEMLKKKIWPIFQRIIELFTQKFVSKLLKIWVWDPGSRI
jgi:hypothetical protein